MEAVLPFRLIFGVLLFVTIALSGYHRRKARKEGGTIARREEGTLALFLRVAFTLPLLITFLLYIFAPQWVAWSQFPLPLWVRWMGVGLGVLCLPLSWWVLTSIGKNISETVLTKKGHELVTIGPYRWVRHPLYAVGMMQILAQSILASNGFMLAFWVIGIFAFRFIVIPKEEENLIKAFGQQYEDYKKRTGALFPRL